ncbi:MAG: hypothetical protein ABII82_12930 [Verrucomicrobiota bacterium]
MNPRRLSFSLLILPALAGCARLAAATVFSTGFSTPANFADHFVALPPSGEARLYQDSHDGGLGLRKTGPGTLSVIFDTSARDALVSEAGAAGSAAESDFTNVRVTAKTRFVDFGAPGLGIWARVPADYAAGCLGLVNVISPDQVRLRIFGQGSTPASATPGALLKDTTLASATPLDTGAFYRVSLTATETAGGTRLVLSLGTDAGELVSTEATAPAGSLPAKGQVGLRTSSKTLVVDELSIDTL